MKDLGVARVSLGSGSSRVAVGALRSLARELRDHGTFGALGTVAIPYPEVQALLARRK
jgi:2-methylisocitrate lyase-like PEP mutase family enzyme